VPAPARPAARRSTTPQPSAPVEARQAAEPRYSSTEAEQGEAAPLDVEQPAAKRRRLPADWPMRLVGWVVLVVVAGAAGTWSFSHVYDLAQLGGATDLQAALLPLCVDGLVLLGTVRHFTDKNAGRATDPAAVVAGVSGVLFSLGANGFMAYTNHGPVGAGVALIPPAALALSLHLAFNRHATEAEPCAEAQPTT
jgi:hypothetical protein